MKLKRKNKNFGVLTIEPSEVRDIRHEALDEHGNLRILPAAYWQTTTVQERALFGNQMGVYSFPTVELVERLRELIAGRVAIEIGAGNGVLAKALGIPATDSYQQEMPQYRALYESIQQPPVRYGAHVIEMDARKAVRFFKPQVVLGCWVTHKYDPKHPKRGGNEVGIDEYDILKNCEEYIFVGNRGVHQYKFIWASKHEIEHPPYVFSRAHNGTKDFIARFKGKK